MEDRRTNAREAAEDLYYGQVVVNWARWFIIGAGILLVLWTADEMSRLAIGIMPVLALMALNFYMHGRHIAGRPANPRLMGLASALDLAVITSVVLFWPESEHRGLASPFFIMDFPVVLSFAFVMPPRATAAYTFAALMGYVLACILATMTSLADLGALQAFFIAPEVEDLVARLITLGAMGALGTFYWRVQRRRRAALGYLSEEL